MPIYEYLCPTCNRIYSFLAKAPAQDRAPVCPKCGARNLRKMISRFAVTGTRRKAQGLDPRTVGSHTDGDAPDPLDDPRVEREMMKLLDAAESMDEKDPRQLGGLMRRMSEVTGEELDPELEEAVRRLEAGEDPERIEEELDGLTADEGSGSGGAPAMDDGLYPL